MTVEAFPIAKENRILKKLDDRITAAIQDVTKEHPGQVTRSDIAGVFRSIEFRIFIKDM